MSDANLTAVANAAAAQTALTERVTGFFDDLNTELDTSQAEIAAQQASLTGVLADVSGAVAAQMYFLATINPAIAAPSNVAGGTFNTIKEAVEAAPAGAYVDLRLVTTSEHEIAESITTHGRKIVVSKIGAGSAVIRVRSYTNNGFNNLRQFVWSLGFVFYAQYVDIVFDDKADVALPWGGDTRAMFGRGVGLTVGLRSCTITGPSDLCVAATHYGSTLTMHLMYSTLDGVGAVKFAALGVTMMGTFSVTLTNGATLFDGGTVGTNILQI